MPTYGIGIDTGGTYTDAVIIDFETGKVMDSAKSLTTRQDLTIGIEGSISKFDPSFFPEVGMVSLSSTLATNSIVEGKGCRTALICIGRDVEDSITSDQYVCIAGGHKLSGEEDRPLDEEAARRFLESIRGLVDSVAITGYLSVRNPEHENRVAEIAREILNVPVICGHELSSSLGFNERSLTCVMNARLIPLIHELIDSVRKVMSDLGIDAPLMVVKGDGSLMAEQVALMRPIETILSGPAASLIGAKAMAGAEDAIVLDMGGTTTDIGILRGGIPRLESEGAVINGRRTHVMAAEISTAGLGGDSRLYVTCKKLHIGGTRVVPLCVAVTQWPCLLEKLRKVRNLPPRFVPQSVDDEKVPHDTEFFYKIRDIPNVSISEDDEKLLSIIDKEPMSLFEAGEKLDIHPFMFNVIRMENLGMIQRIGLTPTDILHAEGSYTQYCVEASEIGVDYAARRMFMEANAFRDYAKQQIIRKLAHILMGKLFFEEIGSSDTDKVGNSMLEKAITHEDGLDFGCRIKINKTIVGIGAPVHAYLPQVAEMFGTDVYLSEHTNVGNAVGAISGNVVQTETITIKPKDGLGFKADPPCNVFASFGSFSFDTYTEAVEFAETKGREMAEKRAVDAGAPSPEVKVERNERRYGFDEYYETGATLLETVVTVTAIGKPRGFGSR